MSTALTRKQFIGILALGGLAPKTIGETTSSAGTSGNGFFLYSFWKLHDARNWGLALLEAHNGAIMPLISDVVAAERTLPGHWGGVVHVGYCSPTQLSDSQSFLLKTRLDFILQQYLDALDQGLSGPSRALSLSTRINEEFASYGVSTAHVQGFTVDRGARGEDRFADQVIDAFAQFRNFLSQEPVVAHRLAANLPQRVSSITCCHLNL